MVTSVALLSPTHLPCVLQALGARNNQGVGEMKVSARAGWRVNNTTSRNTEDNGITPIEAIINPNL